MPISATTATTTTSATEISADMPSGGSSSLNAPPGVSGMTTSPPAQIPVWSDSWYVVRSRSHSHKINYNL
jgi:hypothetical protein